MGIGAPAIGLAGSAQLDLEVAGALDRFRATCAIWKAPATQCRCQSLRDLRQPLQLPSTTATLADQAVAIGSFSAEFKDGPTRQRVCQLPDALPIT